MKIIQSSKIKNMDDRITINITKEILIQVNKFQRAALEPEKLSKVLSTLNKDDQIIGFIEREHSRNDLVHYDHPITEYYSYIIVHTSRLETDEEYFARKKEDEKFATEKLKNEKTEYLRLKAKFENTEFLQYKKAWICLQSSIELLYERGIKAVSVDDIIQSMTALNEEIKTGN